MTKNSDQGVSSHASDGEIHEPPLGVFVLTEFVYCPRAGLCAFETGHEEIDEGPPLSFFSFNPLFSLAEIEAALEQSLNEMTWFTAGAGFSAAFGVFLSMWLDKYVGLVGAIGIVWFLVFATQRGIHAYRLNQQRKAALAAKHNEPDANSTEVQKIYWWDLLKAGFETQPVQDRLMDQELNFSGKPTRFLRRGNVVIPVWRMRHYDGKLFPQNFIRMTAYCHLVQTSLGAGVECPYGVILFGNGLDGVAIPFSMQRRSDFLEALRAARAIIEKSKRPPAPNPPDSPTLCARCPYGEPKPHKPNQSESICNGKALLVIPTIAADGKCFHSLCGDRFRWLPPHEDIEKKDLRSQT